MIRKVGNPIKGTTVLSGSIINCLVCNTVINDTESSDCYNVFLGVSVTSHSNTQLAVKLEDLVSSPIDVTTVHSENLCRKCFMLVDEEDFHEKKANGLKILITEKFGATMLTHQSLATKQTTTTGKRKKLPQLQKSSKNENKGIMLSEEGQNKQLTGSSCGETYDKGTIQKKKEKETGRNEGGVTECIEEVPLTKARQKQKARQKPAVSEKGKKSECAICGRAFSRRYLRDHIKTHSNSRPYSCEVCGETFPYQATLTIHKKIHSEERPHVCKDCGASFRRNQHLLAHLPIHSGERPFACDVCEKTFKIKGDLTVHRRIHTGEKPYTCTFCDRSFAYRDSYILHGRLHRDEKPFVCEQCGKRFVKSCDLLRHQRIHTGEKPYCCKYCGKTFTQNSTLKQHMKKNNTLHLRTPAKNVRKDELCRKSNDKEVASVPESEQQTFSIGSSESYPHQFSMPVPVISHVTDTHINDGTHHQSSYKLDFSERTHVLCSSYDNVGEYNSLSNIGESLSARPISLPDDHDTNVECRATFVNSILLAGDNPL